MQTSESKECTCNKPEFEFWSQRFSDMFNEKIICVDAECPIHGGADIEDDEGESK